MTKVQRPGVKIIFLASLKHRDLIDGIGDVFLPLPVDVAELTEALRSTLSES